MSVNLLSSCQTKGYPAQRRGLSLAPMDTPDTSDGKQKGSLDPRVQAMIADIEAMLTRKRLLNIYRVLGMAMLVREGDPLHPVRLGTISGTGRLMADFKDISFPGYVEIGPRTIGPYGPGMQVWLKASNAFEAGRWVLVARDDGHDLVRCDQRGDTRVLVTSSGDSLMYEPDRHAIVAVSYGRFIPE